MPFILKYMTLPIIYRYADLKNHLEQSKFLGTFF